MKKNMGVADKGIRFLLACILVVVYLVADFSKPVGWGVLTIAAIMLITSFISFCPLYTLLGINTCAAKKPHHAPPSNQPNQHHHQHHHKR